jgi:hypothetical protein
VNELAAFFAGAIVMLTVLFRGNDHPTKASGEGWRAKLRLQVEKLALLVVSFGVGWTLLNILGGASPPPQLTILLVGTALWMVTHPKGWWKFVTRGVRDRCDELRPHP